MKTFFKISGFLLLVNIIILFYLSFCYIWGIEYSNLLPKIACSVNLTVWISFIIGLLLKHKD